MENGTYFLRFLIYGSDEETEAWRRSVGVGLCCKIRGAVLDSKYLLSVSDIQRANRIECRDAEVEKPGEMERRKKALFVKDAHGFLQFSVSEAAD